MDLENLTNQSLSLIKIAESIAADLFHQRLFPIHILYSFFKSEDPIIKDEKGLLQLNNYRPSDIKPIEPVTNRQKNYLNNFKELVKRLTENEGVGTDSKGKEVKLYDYVLDHLSLPFQQPGNKIRSAVLFHSEHYQVGKNTLFEMIRLGLGKDNCTIITPENAVARERNFLENQLVLIDCVID